MFNQWLFFCAQERLLLSILPKHIADEMLQDMKKEASQKEMQQFNTMYMYRHENVRSVCYDHQQRFMMSWFDLDSDCVCVAVFCSQTSWASLSCPRPVARTSWWSCWTNCSPASTSSQLWVTDICMQALFNTRLVIFTRWNRFWWLMILSYSCGVHQWNLK